MLAVLELEWSPTLHFPYLFFLCVWSYFYNILPLCDAASHLQDNYTVFVVFCRCWCSFTLSTFMSVRAFVCRRRVVFSYVCFRFHLIVNFVLLLWLQQNLFLVLLVHFAFCVFFVLFLFFFKYFFRFCSLQFLLVFCFFFCLSSVCLRVWEETRHEVRVLDTFIANTKQMPQHFALFVDTSRCSSIRLYVIATNTVGSNFANCNIMST